MRASHCPLDRFYRRKKHSKKSELPALFNVAQMGFFKLNIDLKNLKKPIHSPLQAFTLGCW
jgi:hypothetical protein